MRAEIHWITGPWPGRLGIVPRPRGGDWLEDEIRAWRDAGLNVAVSLLTPEETAELGLECERKHSRALGIEFRNFPIPDRSVPTTREEFTDLVAELERALEQGMSVAVHCRQGIGRSSLLAASLLIAAGEEAGGVWSRIETARGVPVPDTAEQRDWVMQAAAIFAGVSANYRQLL